MAKNEKFYVAPVCKSIEMKSESAILGDSSTEKVGETEGEW